MVDSLSGYDNSQRPVKPIVLSEVDKQIRAKALENYRAEAQITIDKIAVAQKQLDEINSQINDRQAVLDKIYQNKVDAMADQVKILEDNIALKKEKSQGLDEEISAKLIENQGIQSDFSARQKEIDDQREQQRLQGISLGGIQNQLDLQKIDLENGKKQLEKDRLLFEDECRKRSDNIANIELATTNQQLTNMRQKDDLDYQAHQQVIVAESLNQREQKLLSDQAAAKIIVDQADGVWAQQLRNEARASQLDEQQAQLAVDINQIKATQIALDIQKSDLAARQRVIEAAEKKIAIGG